jgi:hypothetical protein
MAVLRDALERLVLGDEVLRLDGDVLAGLKIGDEDGRAQADLLARLAVPATQPPAFAEDDLLPGPKDRDGDDETDHDTDRVEDVAEEIEQAVHAWSR